MKWASGCGNIMKCPWSGNKYLLVLIAPDSAALAKLWRWIVVASVNNALRRYTKLRPWPRVNGKETTRSHLNHERCPATGWLTSRRCNLRIQGIAVLMNPYQYVTWDVEGPWSSCQNEKKKRKGCTDFWFLQNIWSSVKMLKQKGKMDIGIHGQYFGFGRKMVYRDHDGNSLLIERGSRKVCWSLACRAAPSAHAFSRSCQPGLQIILLLGVISNGLLPGFRIPTYIYIYK